MPRDPHRELNISKEANRICSCLILGEHDLKTTSGNEQNIPIADIIFHPAYNPSNYENDLALIKLSRKARLNDMVKTACLPDQNTTFATGTKCYIAGWGLLEAYGKGPQVRSFFRTVQSVFIYSCLI